jgi:hypothetical protein
MFFLSLHFFLFILPPFLIFPPKDIGRTELFIAYDTGTLPENREETSKILWVATGDKNGAGA